jgi:quercetin dioxygenase-like cupin family protein
MKDVINENLEILKGLTERLVDLKDISIKYSPDYSELKMIDGVGLGFNLFKCKDIAVSRWFFSSGSVLANHTHQEKEWVIVYNGEMTIYYDNNICNTIGNGESCIIEPNTNHSCVFTKNTWCIGITYPATDGYPGDIK